MGLGPDFEVERETITFGSKKKTSFEVRGIGVEDLGQLLASRLTEVEAMYAMFAASKASIYSRSNLDGFVLTLIQKAPDLVAEVISRAADEPENRQSYRRIPFAASAAALMAIVKLSFEEAGGLKNLLATLMSLVDEALPQGARERIESLVAQTEESPTLQ